MGLKNDPSILGVESKKKFCHGQNTFWEGVEKNKNGDKQIKRGSNFILLLGEGEKGQKNYGGDQI